MMHVMAPAYPSLNYPPRIEFSPAESDDALEKVVSILRKHKHEDYYTYERGGIWYIGIGCQASLIIDAKGETATSVVDGKRDVSPINTTLSDIARIFIKEQQGRLVKIHGYVGFNYAAHIRGQPYKVGDWPLLSLMVPRTEVIIHGSSITINGHGNKAAPSLSSLLSSQPTFDSPHPIAIDNEKNKIAYSSLVAKAVAEIKDNKYTKVIVSRAVDLTEEVDMPATLLRGRRGNNPARSFSFSHAGFQATGFSPELVLSLSKGKVTTEPLAGTRSRFGTDEEVALRRQDLLSDPKEIVEHVVSVMAAISELKKFCDGPSVIVEELMAVRDRGSVQHLGSRVVGKLAHGKDGFDAFNVLFPAITASGIPKAPALDAIHRLEDRPRELYSGAVLLIDGMDTFEGTLVLRTVFQHGEKRWIQAGAGIIDQSTPERELMETCEKLASIGPYLVAKRVDSPMEEELDVSVEKLDTLLKRHDSPLEEDEIATEKAAKKCCLH